MTEEKVLKVVRERDAEKTGVIGKVMTNMGHYYVITSRRGGTRLATLNLSHVVKLANYMMNISKASLWFKYHKFPNISNVRAVGLTSLRAEEILGA